MSAFMLRAALAAARARTPDDDPRFSREAETALQVLTATGMSAKDAEAKVASALREDPQADADSIVAKAFGAKP